MKNLLEALPKILNCYSWYLLKLCNCLICQEGVFLLPSQTVRYLLACHAGLQCTIFLIIKFTSDKAHPFELEVTSGKKILTRSSASTSPCQDSKLLKTEQSLSINEQLVFYWKWEVWSVVDRMMSLLLLLLESMQHRLQMPGFSSQYRHSLSLSLMNNGGFVLMMQSAYSWITTNIERLLEIWTESRDDDDRGYRLNSRCCAGKFPPVSLESSLARLSTCPRIPCLLRNAHSSSFSDYEKVARPAGWNIVAIGRLFLFFLSYCRLCRNGGDMMMLQRYCWFSYSWLSIWRLHCLPEMPTQKCNNQLAPATENLELQVVRGYLHFFKLVNPCFFHLLPPPWKKILHTSKGNPPTTTLPPWNQAMPAVWCNFLS